MRMSNLSIQNFKGLRDISIPMSRFVCLIGENNAGKSSVLQAISLFFSGTTLPRTHYFDSNQNVRIQADWTEISDVDLDRLVDEHRSKIKDIVKDGTLILVRVYGPDGKGSLKYRRFYPTEERFSPERIDELLKGKKAGKSLIDAVVERFPELKDFLAPTMNQGDIKAKIAELANGYPDANKVLVDFDLPTGIDKSISAMLSEPIYIPAVKDLKDDVKTTESTPFGKVLGMLLKAIEPHLAEEKTLFEQLNSKLNRLLLPDGSEVDNRLEPVRVIERTVERFVQDTFASVRLRLSIPPPELKAVLSSAQIYANDGVDGLIDTKGDGLRRAIVFAILRSYVELNKTPLRTERDVGDSSAISRYLLLFEEPELYLHPKAQQVLFDALGVFSQKHCVVVTTHSPGFFGPAATTTFVKIRKAQVPAVAARPFALVCPVDLRDTTARDQFQIICYENNNIAFFAETVVLVEGDSDYIVLPHLARLLNPQWDYGQLPVRFARIGGKSNIRRYREFFRRFGTRVLVVTDLDFILGGEFGQIDPPDELRTLRSQLIADADAIIDANGGVQEPNADRTKGAHERGDLKALWRRARQLFSEHKAGTTPLDKVEEAVDQFFAWERSWARRDILKQPPTEPIRTRKANLLNRLRGSGVCVWEKGTIEDYYPTGISGEGKPAQAQFFCNVISTREQVLALCASGHMDRNGNLTSEFEAIFETLFDSTPGL